MISRDEFLLWIDERRRVLSSNDRAERRKNRSNRFNRSINAFHPASYHKGCVDAYDFIKGEMGTTWVAKDSGSQGV